MSTTQLEITEAEAVETPAEQLVKIENPNRLPVNLDEAFEFAKPTFLKLYGKEAMVTFDRERGFAKQSLIKNPLLKQDPVGVMLAVMNVALTGLSLNPVLGFAYLVPRQEYDKNAGKKVWKCRLDPGYKGFCKILYEETGIIIEAETVHECDHWQIKRGTERELIHEPVYESQTDQNIVGAYSVATFPDGRTAFMYLPMDKIRKRMNMSSSYKGKNPQYSPWSTWFVEMVKKTLIRAHWNVLPKGERSGQLVAINDNANPVDVTIQQEGETFE